MKQLMVTSELSLTSTMLARLVESFIYWACDRMSAEMEKEESRDRSEEILKYLKRFFFSRICVF